MLISILGGLVFFALIIVSVLLHELGHMIPAKLFGVKVSEYFAGFGPVLWSKQMGETRYGFRIFPLGGYVRLEGMVPPRDPNATDSWLQRVADGAREGVEPNLADEGRLFYQKPVWQKLIVMAGGITVNLVLAFLLFWSVLGTYGHEVQTTTVARVHECVKGEPGDDGSCPSGVARTPAAQAGLKTGDRIVAWNGEAIDGYRDLSDYIRDNRDREARITVQRDGRRVELTTTTMVTDVADHLHPGKTIKAGFLGFSSSREVRREDPLGTVAEMWDLSKQALVSLAELPVKTYHVTADLIDGKPRDVNSPMSIVGASVVAGDVASAPELSFGQKAATGALLLGGLNLFLFWFNLVPLPPMDGGHLVSALWEGLRRIVARLQGKPQPGHVDTAKLMPVSYVMAILLVAMGGLLILADIISPVRIF